MESTLKRRSPGFLKIAGIGLFIAYTFMLSRSKRDTDRERGEERAIAVDHQQEAALQSYIDRMADLLLRDKLSRFSSDEVRNVARIRTLTVFRGLDSKRKGAVLLFLKDSGLIDREAVIDLGGADLSGASVTFANLNRVNLSEANLSGADLRGTNLGKSYLSGTNLSGANLSRANLGGADLLEANLSGANFNQTNLHKANFNGADLRGCRLNEADLREADLSQADLSGTEITETELEKVKSLEGTTMPDGTKHD
ncbi:MAG: pentapeptide repeat-containing protein [Chloroflexota bacterium]